MADALGLYLGSRSLVLAHLRGSPRSPRVISITSVPLDTPIPVTAQGLGNLVTPLRQLVRQARITRPAVALGITAEAAIIRYFQMPRLPPRDRPAAIRFEAKRYLPFKLEELITDFRVVMLAADPQQMRITFYAAKKELVTQGLQVCREAGLVPTILEPSIVSLVRVARHAHQLELDKAAVLLFVDDDTASLAIVRQDLVYLSRTVTALSPLRPAPEPSADPVGNGSANLYESLLSEMAVSVDYYRRRFAGEPPVTKVIVCSDAAPPSWLRELGSTLELPVDTLRVGTGLTGAPRVTSHHAAAVGLAMRGLEVRRPSINLLPEALRPKPRGILRAILVESAIAALLLASLYHAKAAPIRVLEQRVAQLAAMSPSAGLGYPAGTPPAQLQTVRAEREQEHQFLTSFLEGGLPPAEVLRELAAATPPEIWVRQVLYTDAYTARALRDPFVSRKTLTVAGSAHTATGSQALDVVNRYVAELNRGPLATQWFNRFDLTTVQRNTLGAAEITDFQLANTGEGEGGAGPR